MKFNIALLAFAALLTVGCGKEASTFICKEELIDSNGDGLIDSCQVYRQTKKSHVFIYEPTCEISQGETVNLDPLTGGCPISGDDTADTNTGETGGDTGN